MWHSLQRVVFPQDEGLLALYAKRKPAPGKPASLAIATRFAADFGDGESFSFDTYFNAVFESHWLKWTTVSSWRLSLEVSGRGRVNVYRNRASGTTSLLSTDEFDGRNQVIRIDVAPSNDAAADTRLYFEIEAEGAPVTLSNATWDGEVAVVQDVAMAVGFSTYNRETYVLANIETFLSDELLWQTLQRLIIVEQSEEARLEEAIATRPQVHDKVQVIRQANFGGSGGFTRAIMEALDQKQATHILLMDDDVQIEPECILRTVAFFSVASNGVAVGGQMLRLDDPTTMHESGAVLSPKTLRVLPFDRGQGAHSERMLTQLSQHRRIDYGSWFYFALSLDAVRHVGLPLPFFIVFDDVEYGMRLARHGTNSVTMPGIAVWHETGQNRDARWKTYYYQRNVLIVNALYQLSPALRPGILFMRHWLRRLIKRDLAQPALACDALGDYLRGPSVLGDDPIARTTSARRLCAATPHRQASTASAVVMALKVVILGCCLALRGPGANRSWRAAAAEMTTTAWWRRYLRLSG